MNTTITDADSWHKGLDQGKFLTTFSTKLEIYNCKSMSISPIDAWCFLFFEMHKVLCRKGHWSKGNNVPAIEDVCFPLESEPWQFRNSDKPETTVSGLCGIRCQTVTMSQSLVQSRTISTYIQEVWSWADMAHWSCRWCTQCWWVPKSYDTTWVFQSVLFLFIFPFPEVCILKWPQWSNLPQVLI